MRPVRSPHLPLLAALLASAVAVGTTLATPAWACGGDSVIVWSQPTPSVGTLPADAVFRVLVGEGDSARDTFSLELTQLNGTVVPSTTSVDSHSGDTPYEDRYLHTLVPDAPLTVGERYLLRVRHSSGDDSLGMTVAFDATAARGSGITALPKVEVLSAYGAEGEGDTGCDYGEVKVYEVAITPAEIDAEQLSVLHLYRVEDEADDSWAYVWAGRVPTTAGTLTQELRTDRYSVAGGCFIVVQEDITGAESPPSIVACSPEPLQAEEATDDSGVPGAQPQGDSGSACRGCAAGGGGSAGLLLVGLAALLGRRRRG